MKTESYRGIVRGGVIQLLEKDSSLTDGMEVVVTPVFAAPGTAAAVLAALAAAPHVPSDWVDELEQIIAAGQRPPDRVNPFSEQHAG